MRIEKGTRNKKSQRLKIVENLINRHFQSFRV